MSHSCCWKSALILAGTVSYLHVASPNGLGFLTTWWLGFKGKDNILLLCRKGRVTSTLSLALRPLEQECTMGKYHLETGHGKSKNPEFMHWLDTEKMHMCSILLSESY